MQKQTLGQKIAELRKSKNMTQLELAQQLNITDKAVSKWERDISCPDINSFPKLAEILDVSVDELLSVSREAKEGSKEKDVINIVFKAVPLAMSVAVVMLTVLDQLHFEDAAVFLGIGMFCLAIRTFREK